MRPTHLRPLSRGAGRDEQPEQRGHHLRRAPLLLQDVLPQQRRVVLRAREQHVDRGEAQAQCQRAVLCYSVRRSHRWLFFRYNVSAVETRPLRVQRLRDSPLRPHCYKVQGTRSS